MQTDVFAAVSLTAVPGLFL